MTIRTVGSGKQFATLAAAVSAASSGDTISVDTGTYTNDFCTINKALTISGVGGLARFVATVQPPNGKAYFVTQADIACDHIEVSGVTVPDANGAAFKHEGGNLTLTSCVLHDNEDGVLTAPGSGMILTIDTCEIYGNGLDNTGQTHGVYAGIIAQLIVRNSYFHDHSVGHEIKSRALSTLIEDNRIYSGPTGTDSYAIDLPVGGAATVRRNIIVEGANSQNPYTIHYGGEAGSPHPGSSLAVSANTIVNDGGTNRVALLNAEPTVTATFSGNSLFAYQTATQGPVTVSGTVTLGSRPATNTSPISFVASGGIIPMDPVLRPRTSAIYNSPQALPALGANETVGPTDPRIVYTTNGPRRESLMQTAAFLSAQGYTVTAPGTGAPTVTINDLTLTLYTPPRANSPANTAVGMLGATVSGGSLAGLVITLPNSASGDFKVSGAQVQLAVSNVPAGSYTIRARFAATNLVAPGYFEKDFTVSIAAAAAVVPPPQPTAGSGLDYDFGYGKQNSLVVELPYKHINACAAGQQLTTLHGFGLGDLPKNSWRVKAKLSDGTPLTIQQDLENSHLGNVGLCAITWNSPSAMAAGQTTKIILGVENIAPDRTPFIAATGTGSITATQDFKYVLSGLDFAPADLECSFNWILANCLEFSQTTGWGTNPIGGWRYRRKGSKLVGIHAWCYARNPSNGQTHAYVRVDMNLWARADGAYQIIGKVSQSNAYGVQAAGAIGAVTAQPPFKYNVELRNGATVLYRWGGANGISAFDVDASAFNGTGFTLPAGALDTEAGGLGVPVMFSGNLPSGLNNSTVYYMDWNGQIQPSRLGRNPVSVGSGGSGTIRVMPIVMTWPNTATVLATPDSRRVWVGNGSEPKILPAHDQMFHTRRCRLFVNFDLSYTVPDTGERKFGYVTSAASEFSAGWNGTGDSETTDRIGGELPYRHARAFLNPYDEALDQNTRSQALVHHSGMFHHVVDERSGFPPVHTRGPNSDGVAFPGMGPCNIGFRTFTGNLGINTGSPPFGGNVEGKWHGTISWESGIGDQYQLLWEGSHRTEFNYVPAFRSGDEFYTDTMEIAAMTNLAGDYSDFMIGDRRVSGVAGQGDRTSAHIMGGLYLADMMIPDDSPVRAVLFKLADDNTYAANSQALTSNIKHLGIIWGVGRPWHYSMYSDVLANALIAGRHNTRASVECMSKFIVDTRDDQGVRANAGALMGEYGPNQMFSDPPIFPNIGAMIDGAWGTGPFPATGFGATSPGYPYLAGRSDYRRMAIAAITDQTTCHLQGLAYIPNAERVRGQLIYRATTNGSSIRPEPGVETWSRTVVDLPAADRVLLTQPLDGPATGGTISGPVGGSSEAQMAATFAVTITGAGFVWAGLDQVSNGNQVGQRVQLTVSGNVDLIPPAQVAYKPVLYTAENGGTKLAEGTAFTPAAYVAPSDDRGPYTFTFKPNSRSFPVTQDSGGANAFVVAVAIADGTRYPGDITMSLSRSKAVYNDYAAGMGEYPTVYYQGTPTDFVFYRDHIALPTAGSYYLWARTADGRTGCDPLPYTVA